MILKETILSAFTERGTLLKWLKKVEAALNADVLTDISVEQIDETHVKLKFTFENDSFVESPVLTLARGKDGDAATIRVGRVTTGEATTPASVVNVGTESAAVLDFVIPRGRDGLDGEGIAATVEVGTVTTGAAGTNASVTNAGTEQRAILNFVIPRGDTGESGAEGSAGVGFDDADEISINDGNINITAGDNGVNIEASFEVAVGEEILEIPSTMYLPLKGSESIVIDVDESGDFVEIHLDADIAAKLGRVLVTPMSAPASVSLVAVDTSNAQTMLTLGSGLSVEGGVLSASGGGGGGGTQMYRHNVTFSGGSIMFVASEGTPANNIGTLAEQVQTYGGMLDITVGTPFRASVFSVTTYDYDIPSTTRKFFYINDSGIITEQTISGSLADEVTPL